MIKFWPSCAPAKGVCGGAKIFGSALLRPARSVCVSPSTFFISLVIIRLYLNHWDRGNCKNSAESAASAVVWYLRVFLVLIFKVAWPITKRVGGYLETFFFKFLLLSLLSRRCLEVLQWYALYRHCSNENLCLKYINKINASTCLNYLCTCKHGIMQRGKSIAV